MQLTTAFVRARELPARGSRLVQPPILEQSGFHDLDPVAQARPGSWQGGPSSMLARLWRAGQGSNDLVAETLGVRAEVGQDLARSAVRFPGEPEEDVLAADVV